MRAFFIKELLLVLAIVSPQLHAQNSSTAKHQFPTNAASYCLDIEQNITKYFRWELEKIDKTVKLNNSEEQKRSREGVAFMEKQRKEYEETWQRMNCAVILYSKK